MSLLFEPTTENRLRFVSINWIITNMNPPNRPQKVRKYAHYQTENCLLHCVMINEKLKMKVGPLHKWFVYLTYGTAPKLLLTVYLVNISIKTELFGTHANLFTRSHYTGQHLQEIRPYFHICLDLHISTLEQMLHSYCQNLISTSTHIEKGIF